MGKITQLLTHPSELQSVIQLLYLRKELHPKDEFQPETLKNCYKFLKVTSRSFAAVIQELHPELRDAVMLFYLVLRGLDTVEDDMSLEPTFKINLLRSFDLKLNTRDWTFDGSSPTEKDRIVLVQFDQILTEYHKLKPEYQDIVKDITKKMGNGMADYILDELFNLEGVKTCEEYDLYCHYVAGLVGEGLTKLMVLAKFSDDLLVQDNFEKSNSMGLFLQKTNIIRDYHEDLLDGRSFWPKEIWGKYTDKYPSFHEDPSAETQGLYCISNMVLDAMTHIKDVLSFLSLVKDPSSFNFCAIPQVMAVATLALVYQNKNVLHGNVKLRKGLTCSLILSSRTLPGVVAVFKKYAREIHHKSVVEDPNYLNIGVKCAEVEKLCELMYPSKAGVERQQKPINKVIEDRRAVDEEIQALIDTEESVLKIIWGGLFGTVIALVLLFGGYV